MPVLNVSYSLPSGTTSAQGGQGGGPAAPSIVTQPQAQAAIVGSTATYSVVATGDGPLTYQWRKNGTNISGATSASYTTPALTAPDNGAVYSVVVTGPGGSVTSFNAGLTVTASNGNAGPFTPAPATALTTATINAPATGVRPWCIGQPFRKGDMPAGAALSGIQMTVKNTWPDGSARFAVLSSITTLASTAHTVNIGLGAAPTGSALTTADLLATGVSASFSAGAFGTAEWAASSPDWYATHETWANGPVMSSWLYRKPLSGDDHLVAWMEVRLYATGDIEVLPWIENGYTLKAGATNKDATYSFTLNGVNRFNEAIDFPNHTRSPLIGTSSPLGGTELSYWAGTSKAVIPKHAAAYLMATEMVPTYGATTSPSAVSVTTLPSSYSPLQQGSFPTAMGSAGADKSIGVIPEFETVYLTCSATSIYAAIERNGFSAGRYGLVHRDEATNRPIRFSDHPNLQLDSGNNAAITDSAGSITGAVYTANGSGTTPPEWKTSHHPSVGYMAALLSGRRFHLDTLQFSANIGYLKQRIDRRENANGVIIPYISTNNVRGAAWSLRTLAQAAALTPNDDPLKSDYVASWGANVANYHYDNVVVIQHPQGFVHPTPADTSAYSRSGSTGSGSTSTEVILAVGASSVDDYMTGWNLHIGGSIGGIGNYVGGESRVITAYNGTTKVATVSPAFTISTASVSYYSEVGPYMIVAGWMQDFMTAAFGYGKAMDLGLTVDQKAKETELFSYFAESVLGRIGGVAADEYLYRDVGQYHISIAPTMRPDWTAARTTPWYDNWGEIWQNSYDFDPGGMGPKELGDGSLRGDSGDGAYNYLANALPAIAYTIRHGIAGATAKYELLKSAPDWPIFQANLDANPVWAAVPHSDPLATPYALPIEGAAVTINGNLPNAVKPAAWSDLAWHYSAFGSYGGGTYVPDYSTHGAYVLAGSGGHNHPDHTGAIVFDFSTGLWSRLDCANPGFTPKPTGAAYADAETNGAPHYEVLGTEVPAPPHPYRQQMYMAAGDKGSVIYVTRGAVAVGARPAYGAHRFDLATRVWSRVAAANVQNIGGSECSVAWDAGRQRWWITPTNVHNFNVMLYLDATDMQWKTVSIPTPPSSIAVYSALMMHDSLLIRSSGSRGLWIFDPDTPSAGWIQATVSGTLPETSTIVPILAMNNWARYSDGRWYSYNGYLDDDNTIQRVTPPVDPKTGTWVCDSVTVTGATITHDVSNGNPSGVKHYTRFFYVDALDCLCWIAGANSSVFLMKPPA